MGAGREILLQEINCFKSSTEWEDRLSLRVNRQSFKHIDKTTYFLLSALLNVTHAKSFSNSIEISSHGIYRILRKMNLV